MNKTVRSSVLAVGAVSLALFGAACGSGDMASSGSSSSAPMTSSSMAPSTSAMADPAKDLVGPGCADYAKQVPSGSGSVAGMAADPVATAASNNPLLKTLVQAVSGQLNPKVNLVSTLNGGEFTVFAPVDSAFAKIDAATIDKLKTDDALLTKILTYHVVPGQISPDKIVGDQKTVETGTVKVSGTKDALKVNDANVIC
ncbi:fasciclin domain-containing protein, partial [Lentzea sp.]|uniref:fasciclin domain-containing protein n=1 Tax=Lentzea sp. TaxID=56099 RepID=UPI002ED47A20